MSALLGFLSGQGTNSGVSVAGGLEATVGESPEVTENDESVAKVVANNTKKKAELLKEKIDNKETELKKSTQQAEELKKKLVTISRSKVSLEEKYKGMVAKKRKELVAQYRKVVTKLKQHPMVDKFAVDSKKRVLVTTKPIKIKKEKWKRARTAGVYQIRIDFSKEKGQQGIEILNLTHRHKEYDSPTVQDTEVCWGNIGPDINNDYESQDLYELIIDLIDFLQSPSDKDGFLEWPESPSEDYKGGWEQFFSELKKQPKDFSFDKYDQNKKSKRVNGVRVSDTGSINYEISEVTHWEKYNPSTSTGGGATSPSTSVTVSTTSNFTGPGIEMSYEGENNSNRRHNSQIGRIREEMGNTLRAIGFTQQGAYHYAHLLTPEGGLLPSEIELTLEGEQIILYVKRSVSELSAMSAVSENTAPSPTEYSTVTTEKLFVNRRDIINIAFADIRRETKVYRFAFSQQQLEAFQQQQGQGEGEGEGEGEETELAEASRNLVEAINRNREEQNQ